MKKLTVYEAQKIAIQLSEVDNALNRTVEHMSNEIPKMSYTQALYYTRLIKECCDNWLVEYHSTTRLMKNTK